MYDKYYPSSHFFAERCTRHFSPAKLNCPNRLFESLFVFYVSCVTPPIKAKQPPRNEVVVNILVDIVYNVLNEGNNIYNCSINDSMSKPSRKIKRMVLSPAIVPRISLMPLLSIGTEIALA